MFLGRFDENHEQFGESAKGLVFGQESYQKFKRFLFEKTKTYKYEL